jgi:hypothetical protein
MGRNDRPMIIGAVGGSGGVPFRSEEPDRQPPHGLYRRSSCQCQRSKATRGLQGWGIRSDRAWIYGRPG